MFTELFDLDAEREIGHIRLSREADLIVVAPATADLLAKMAGGHADDLASSVLLATDKPVLVAPAMNPRMWSLRQPGATSRCCRRTALHFVGPEGGEMAERGEAGTGRLAEVPRVIEAIEGLLRAASGAPGTRWPAARPSRARHQRADPRADRSRALHRQPLLGQAGCGHRRRGGEAGRPRHAGQPARSRTLSRRSAAGVEVVQVETAQEMLEAVRAALPADIAIFAAAVADWRVARAAEQKIKKRGKGAPPSLALVENADILKTIATAPTPSGRRW